MSSWGLWGLHTAADEDYRDSHQAPGPEDGAPMHDVTQGIYPASFYDDPFHYWGSDEGIGDRASWGTVHRVRGNPDARVKVHRALPLDVARRERGIGLAAPLNTGDWVTPSYNYAHEHGMSRLEGNIPWTVVTSTVPASQLHTNGDSLAEWGYNGPPTQGYEGSDAAGKRKYRQQQVRKQQINAETAKDFHHCGFCGSPSGEPCERGCWGKKKYPGERDVRGDTPSQPGVSGGGEIDYDPGALRDIRLSNRTASTDGIRYAYVVKADVAEDLLRLGVRRAAGPRKPQDPQAVVDRLRALNHRHFLHRTTRPLPDRVLSQHPPLSVQEEAERQKLNSMTTKLHDRWNEMTPLTDGEMALHQALHPMDHRKDDLDSMSDRQKAEHFADLHHLPEVAFGRMPREQHQYDRLKPWAEHYFGNMENDVQDEVERHRQYLQTGRHPSGVTSLEGLDDAHRPELTGAWASELAANGTGKRLRARQEEYHQALHRVATHGPLHRDQNQLADMYAFQHLDNARNNLRVELQHAYLFRVPHTDELSPIEEPSERHARSGLANPRYAHGTGGKTVAAQMAYQVNCQRCVLAAEARHRGHNVEARPNYRDATDSSGNDRQFQDHDIATWFRNADGTVPKWIDAEDQFDPDEYKPTDYGRPTMKHDELPDGGYGLRLKHQPGEKQWDHMHEQIKSWGPGARGAVVMSTPTLTGNSHTRHIIHVVVDDKGKVNYIDPQTGNNDASHHRESIGYNLHPENQTKRLWVDKRPIDEDDKVALHNQNMSPLRFMRLDDKQLAPGTAQHMVDRGTANGRGIIPPDTTTTS